MPRSVRDLVAAIDKKDGKALARIAGDLDALGDEVQTAIPALLGLLKTAPEDLATPALEILRRRGRPTAAQARELAGLLAVPIRGVRPYARDALVRLGKEAKEALPDATTVRSGTAKVADCFWGSTRGSRGMKPIPSSTSAWAGDAPPGDVSKKCPGRDRIS
jgi:hypothetical protein